jgi:hypothetical protein
MCAAKPSHFHSREGHTGGVTQCAKRQPGFAVLGAVVENIKVARVFAQLLAQSGLGVSPGRQEWLGGSLQERIEDQLRISAT